jgi:hypothetical protein
LWTRGPRWTASGTRGPGPTSDPQEVSLSHGLINYKDFVQVLRQVFTRVFRLSGDTVRYFRPSFVNCCPSNLPSGLTLNPLTLIRYSFVDI